MSMPDAHGSQKNASDPQDLKLQNAVSCHVDAKIPTGSSARSASALNC